MKIIAVAGGSGHGKTWLTRRIATCLSEDHGNHLLIVDLDELSGSNISSYYLQRERILTSQETITHALANPLIVPYQVNHQISLFVGNTSLKETGWWAAEQRKISDGSLRSFFQTWPLTAQFDYCLIDCAPDGTPQVRATLVAADLVLLSKGITRDQLDERGVQSLATDIHILKQEQALPENILVLSQALEDFGEDDFRILTIRILRQLNQEPGQM